MVRRSAPWSSLAVPVIRDAVCASLVGMVARQSDAVNLDPEVRAGFSAAHVRKFRRLTAKLTESLDGMRDELQGLRRAQLYWVSRDMVPVAVEAAQTLPEWTPALAMPVEAGLLCWAKPAGTVDFFGREAVPWDAAWWWRRPDGLVQIQVASRLVHRHDLVPPRVSAPLWSGTTVVVNPEVARTAEVNGDPEASEFVKVLGATWLLMDQRTVADLRVVGDRPPAGDGDEGGAAPSTVSLVELRRRELQPQARGSGASGRAYKSRWTVEGHWRQQACGPQWSQRKPLYITEYEKGPVDAPRKESKVHVWRR